MLFADIVAGSIDGDEEKQWTKKTLLKEERTTPLTDEEVLRQMEEEKRVAVERDEKKLRHEAQKIAHLRHKIEKQERK
jgi:hypothetical protein